MDKLKSIINTKNLWHSGVFSDNFRDEVVDCSDNLRAIAEKVDPTHTSIMKRKEGNCIGKSTSDSTNGEKIYKETKNIEDLVKRNRRG